MGVCGHVDVSTKEGGSGGIFVGEYAGKIGGAVVRISVVVGVVISVRMPVLSGTSVGQLVPFSGVNVVSGMTTGGISEF